MAARAVTRRESDVLDALADRSSNAEIAARLCVSERTVESHVSALLRKLGAHDRAELARLARHRAGAAALRLPPMIEPLTRGGPLLGRGDAITRLLECWERAVSVGWGVAMVTGEAGIGKSSLVAHVATEVNRRGGRVLFGACTDGSQASYQPFVEPLTEDLVAISDAELRRRARGHEHGLIRIVPDVVSRLSLAPAGPIVDRLHERDAVQAALQTYVTRVAEAHPTLFVIEDLHWASEATRDVVVRLARTPARAPLMILVTTRDSAPDLDAALERFLGAMARAPAVDVVELAGLDLGSAAELIAGVGSDLDAERARQETGGNPLFLREMATAGHASRTMRELVADRYARLTDDDLDVLDVAVVVGEVFDWTLVAESVRCDPSDVVAALERAEAAGLVVADARPGRCAFVHAVFRAVRYEALTQGRRMRIHAAVARALEPRADDPRVIADLARHACIAFPVDRTVDAVELARRAGDQAAAAADHGEAVGHYGRALEALDLLADPDEQVRLMITIRLGEGLVLSGDRRGREMLLDAARSARRTGDATSLAEAICALVPIPGMSTTFLHDDVPFRSLAEHALEMLPRADAAWRVRVLAVLGAQIAQGGNDARLGMEMVARAVDEARSLGDPVTLGRALLSFRFSGGPFDIEARTACGHELVALGDVTGLEVFAYAGRQTLWWCAREMGDIDEVDRWYESARQHVKGRDVEQLSHEATVALLRGDLDRARELTDDLAELAHGLRLEDLYGPMLRHVIRDCRGRTPDVERLRHITTTLQGRTGAFMRALLADSCARTGLLSEAQMMLDDARRTGFDEYSMCVEWPTLVAWWGDTAALTGDVTAAAELIDVLLPLAGRLADAGMVVTDTVDRVLAMMMLTVGDVDGAAATARRAVAASRSRNMPIMLGRELVVLAAALRRGGTGFEDVDALVTEASKIAGRTGARIIDHDAERFDLAAPTPPSRLPGHLGLTPRECEVLERVATGAANRQIAAELGISPSTVRKHLEHAYAKLHVSTRTGAVARLRADIQPRGDRLP